MPSVTHQILEYALLLALGSVLLLDRFSPHDLLLSPDQYALHRGAALALVAVLLLVHHWRKELLPAYIAAALRAASLVAVLVSVSSPTEDRSSSPYSHSVWAERLAVVGVMLAALLAVLFPLPDLASLHGKYQTIGCRTLRLDGVECRVFYPSAKHSVPVPATQRVPYLHHGKHLAKGIQHFSGVPAWFFNNLENAYLAAIQDAPVATPEASTHGFPLVVFSHGLGGALELYSYLNQQLASAGNVVVVVSHGDGSASVTHKVEDAEDNARVEYYQQITDAVRHNVDGEGFRFRNAQLRTRVQEVRRVLDAVSELSGDKDQQLWKRVDLQRVHAAGHSFGAATALTATHEDARFGAAVLLDAWMEPVDQDVLKGLGGRAPVLHLGSDPFARWKVNADRITQHAQGCRHSHTRVKRIAGSRHNNFSDLPLFSPIINRLVKAAGSIDPKYALRVVAKLSAAFLVGQYDAAAKQFPEVLNMDTIGTETNKKTQ